MKIARIFLFYILSILLIFATLTTLFFVYGVFPMFQQLQFHEFYDISLGRGRDLIDSAGQEKHLMTIIVYAITAVSFAYVLLILIYISRNVVKPIEKAVDFSDSLARGEFPEKLRCGKGGSDEIFALVKSLNFLRDRLHNSINKLKSSHQREKKARENAENVDALKSDFLSRLSPELRSPLNAILGFAEIIENDIAKGCYDPLLQQRVEAIWRNAETLNRQIASLLDLGAMPTSTEGLNVTEFSTADFMRQLVEYNAFCLHEKNISFVNHFSPDAPEFLSSDREVLLFVLSTLIKALARASGKGETISCGCSREDDKIVFWVRDNRKSDSNESLASLFKRFQLGKSKDISTAAPAVINLRLVVSKVELIGGEVSAESTDAHNSEFRLSFKAWRIVPEHTTKHSGPHSASNNQDLNKTPFDIDADESFHIEQEKQHYRALSLSSSASNTR
ncbi:MAG: HAMP domain-containing sensor histidine kinase [Victivallaceae bacterium]